MPTGAFQAALSSAWLERIQRLLLLSILMICALVAHQHPLPLLLDYHFNLGPIFIWLMYLTFGLPWSLCGCLVLLVAASQSVPEAWLQAGYLEHWMVTGQPHESALLFLEIIVVHLIRRKRSQKSLVLLVGGFWAFIGMPSHILVHGFSLYAPSIVPDSLDNFAMNLALVEFLNALLAIVSASLLVGLFPRRWLRPSIPIENNQLFADYLFNILAIAVAGPALALVILSAQPARTQLTQLTVDKVKSNADFADLQVQIWFSKRVAEVERFAKLGSLPDSVTKLQAAASDLETLFPEFRRMTIVDAASHDVLSFGAGPEVSPTDRTWAITHARTTGTTSVKEINGSRIQKPPPPQAGKSDSDEGSEPEFQNPSPTAADLLIAVPIFDDPLQQRFVGAVLCELDVSLLGRLLTEWSARADSRIFLMDSENREVATPDNLAVSKTTLHARLAALIASGKQGPGIFVHHPAADNEVGSIQLAQTTEVSASFLQPHPVATSRFAEYVSVARAPLPVPWTIVVALSPTGPTSELERRYIQTFEILLAIIFLGLGAVKFGSRRVTQSLTELAELTSELSRKVSPFPKSKFLYAPFAEIRDLQSNFAALTNSLVARFAELAEARAELENRVDERTALLRVSNDSLATEISVRRQLTEDRDRIIGILQASADFVCMFTPEGQILWLNAFASHTMGVAEGSDLSTLRIQSFHPPWANSLLADVAVPGALAAGYWVGESAIVDASEQTIPVSQMLIAHRDASGTVRHLSAVMRDMRQFKKIQEELENARLDAERANRTKTLFMANMSHEIRTPVTVIRGFSELLADHVKLEEEPAQWLSAILSSSKQLELLINDILDISKAERGVVILQRAATSLTTLISEVRSPMEFAARQKNIELKFETLGLLPSAIHTDPHRLKQILLNLIGNAIKFTSEGRVGVVVSMKPTAWSADAQGKDGVPQRISFLVSDTGIGIALENQDRLFQPFVQADSSITRRFGGSGLGLFLSKQLAINLGGDIFLRDSRPGQGSCFELEISYQPVADSSMISDFAVRPPSAPLLPESHSMRSENGAPPSRTATVRPPLEDIKVLVVEDSPDIRLLVGQILKSRGAHCTFATNGAEAVSLIIEEAQDFHIVLMDIQMPIMDGYAAATKLRASGYGRPIIALTAHALVGQRDRCIASGFSDCLTKPIEVRRLIETVQEWTREREIPRAMPSVKDPLGTDGIVPAPERPGARPGFQNPP